LFGNSYGSLGSKCACRRLGNCWKSENNLIKMGVKNVLFVERRNEG